MAGKIKGITIEFRGDTTSIDKALRKVQSETKAIDAELKKVNNALKFNPTSVDLWRSKQDLLKKKIVETEDKLKLLKEQQKHMDAAGVDKNSLEYQKLRREIIETESKLKLFKKQLREVGNANLKALSEQFTQFGKKAEDVGKKVTKNVTVPIAAVGAASIKAFNEVKDGLNVVAQKTGATGDELEAMQTSARNLAKTLPTDFNAAGTAIGEVNTRFGVMGDELEKLSGQYIKFAKVNGTDLNNSIDQTQKALAAFGQTAKDAPGLLDTLTRASQLTGASVDTLTSGLIQNATAFQALGLNMNQSVMLMAQLEKSGANSETVMQGLRKALKNAAKEGKPLDQALAELQDTIENGSGSMDGLTAAYDLFGKSGDQIYGAVKNGTLDFRQLGEAALETGGALDSVFNETLTPAEQFQMTMNNVKDAGYELGSAIMTILEPYMKKLAKGAQKLSKWWSELDPQTKDLIVKIGLLAAVIGPVILIIGKLATAIGAIINIVNMAGAAIGVLAGPIGIAIAAIVALIAIGVLLYKHWDQIKAKAIELKNKIVEIWNGIKTSVTDAAKNLVNGVTSSINSLKTKVTSVFKAIGSAITSPIKSAVDYVKSGIGKLKDIVNNAKLKLPHIKLPHFKINGGKLPWGIGGKGYPPSVSIDWYAQGGIFNKATLAGIGESGPEAVLPLDTFWKKLDRIADAAEANSGEVVINVYAPQGMDVNELAAVIEAKLVANQRSRNKVWST